MQKIYRHVLLFLTLVTFIALAPLVILYAIGYRATLQNIDPLPIGVAIVKSHPSRALIYVDDQLSGKTPKTLPNLIAGTKKISLALSGYRSWDKQINIKPGIATDLSNILLFPEDTSSQSLAEDASTFSLSPNRKLIAYVSSDLNLFVVDQDNHPIIDGQKLTFMPRSLLWSPNSAALLLSDKNNYWLVDNFVASSPLRLTELTAASDTIWDPVVPNRLLFIDTEGNLKALGATTNSVQIIAKQINNFATSNRYIYAVNGNNNITVYDLSGVKQNLAIPAPNGVITKLLITPSGSLAYQLQDTSIWYLTEDNQPILVSQLSMVSSWSPDGELLVITPDQYTLSVFSITDEISFLPRQQLQFIARLSRPITDIQWFAGSRHLIYQVADEIIISEIDIRDHPISEQITTTNTGNAQTAVGTDGTIIYYLKKSSIGTGLYQSKLVIAPQKPL